MHPSHVTTTPRTALAAALAGTALLCACAKPTPAPTTPAAPPPPVSAGSPVGQRVVVEGVLTRKGPDLDSWWAVTTASGETWRIEAVDPQNPEWNLSQQHRVRVQGVRQANFLSTPVLRLETWSRPN